MDLRPLRKGLGMTSLCSLPACTPGKSFPNPWAAPHAGSRVRGSEKRSGRVPPHLCFWTGSHRESPMWSESQGATLSTCWGMGNAEKPCRPQDCPQTQPRGKTGHAGPSHFGAVHGLHFPEPVLWEEATHKNVIFVYQVLLLQHVLGWGQWARQ